MTRRAALGGGLSVALFPLAARGAETFALTAAPRPEGGSGFDGALPGPLLRVRAGEPLTLRFRNAMPDAAALALVGLRLPNPLCGFAGLTGPALAPGETRESRLAPREPGFGFYAACGAPGGFGGDPFGLVVIDESSPPPVDLDAIVALAEDGGRLRANADPAPLRLRAPPGGRVRLRLANAAPERTLLVRLDGAQPIIVAIDGAPSETFVPRDHSWPMAPSSRFELMFDMRAEARVTVSTGDAPALTFDAHGAPVAPKPAVVALPSPFPREIPLERAHQVAVKLTGDAERGYAVNGVVASGWPTKPLFRLARGAAVTLGLENATAEPQTMRLEGHVARQLHALDDGWDPYWRDALSVAPGKTSHFAFVVDNPGKWPLASASPQRRGRGLIAWCEVT